MSNRTRRQQGLTSPTPARKPKPKRLQWTPLASVAVAALVIIASFGIWFTSGNQEAPPPPEAPQLAGLVPILASPEATLANTSASCASISADTRVMVVDAPTTPAGTTNDYAEVWLSDAGDVIARCPDGAEIVLAEGMSHLNNTESNQIVVYGQTEDRQSIHTYHHLSLGKTIDDSWTLKPTFMTNGVGTGMLRLVISSQDHSQWSLANFDSMEESTLEELTGQKIYSGQSITAVESADGQVIAIAISMYETEGSAIVLTASGAPGDVMVINSDFSEVHWVAIPDGIDQVNNLELSDDGSELTFIAGNPHDKRDQQRVTVDISTGEIINN